MYVSSCLGKIANTADDMLLYEAHSWKKSLLMNEKEEQKVGLKLNIQKTKIMASGICHHFMANRWGNSRNSDRLYFGGLQNNCKGGSPKMAEE